MDSRGPKAVVRKILQGKWDQGVLEREGVSSGGRELVERILVVDPEERIGIREVLGHEWFEGARDEILEGGREMLDGDVFKRFERWGGLSKFQRVL